MHATLLESNSDFTAMLPCAFDEVGIPLTVVGTVAAVHRAAVHAGPNDFIVVDCSLARSEDEVRCSEIVQHTAVDVHIIYDLTAPNHEDFRRHITQIARGGLKWLPASVGLIEVLTTLRDLRDPSLAVHAQAPRRPLTPHQQRILALVAADRSHAQVAAAIGASVGTVKRDIARIKAKLGVTSTEELKFAFRWMADH